VVVGAGAAGIMAAIHAGGGPRPVLLLERTTDGGRKILISGGGRCNVLPSRLDPGDFVTDSSPHTLRKMLLSWPLQEQIAFFQDDLGIPLVLEEETGKLFPAANRAREVRDRLLEEARKRGVEIRFGARVATAEPTGEGEGVPEHGSVAPWTVRLEGPLPPIPAAAVVIATGGLSVPATGSDGTGLAVAAATGHQVNPTYPALTPLTLDPPVHAPLAGVSLPVVLTSPEPGRRGRDFRTAGGFLFTHRGYSGPTVLNASHLAVRSRMAGGPFRQLRVCWTPREGPAWDRELREGAGTVVGRLRPHLPGRLADRLMEEAGVPADRAVARLTRDERVRVVEALTAYPLPWTGDEGYRKAEVTGGGVALGEVDPGTLESRRHPGLFFCGEVLDAFGPIGGYNFAWAWATGRAAGRGAAGTGTEG